MQYDEFIRQVQQQARLSGRGEAVAITRATLQSLAERIPGTAVEDLAAQLPPGISDFLDDESLDNGQKFDLDEFLERIADRADVDEEEAMTQTRAVIEILSNTIPPRTLEKLLDQLPTGYERLFATGGVSTGRRGSFSIYDSDDYGEDE